MIPYTNIRIFTSEKARHEGRPLANAVVHYLHGLKIAARCAVFRGREGLYETGEIASDAITDLSYNLPLLIDILVPTPEAERVLQTLKTMVRDGFIGTLPTSFVSYQSDRRLLPAHLLVRDLMTAPAVPAHLDFSVRAVVEILLDRGLKALPVVNESGVPVGIVTTTDLLAAGMPVRPGLFPQLPASEREAFLAKAERMPVTGVMRTNPTVVSETTRASHAAHLMVEQQRKRLPVVDAQGRLVGMVARIDLLRAVSAQRPGAGQGPNEIPSAPRRVGDIGKLTSVPVRDTDDLRAAIDVLVQQGEERAAVVDSEGRLVGMVSDRELFGVFHEAGLGNTLRRLFVPTRPYARVSEVMRRDILRISQDASLDEALRTMVDHGVKRLPVVDGLDRFLGMIRRDALLIALSHDL